MLETFLIFSECLSKIYNSTELSVEPVKQKPIRVLMTATKKVVPVNSTDGSEQKENKPIGPPITLSEEMLPTQNWTQPITVTLEQTKKPENTTNQTKNKPVFPIEAFELVKTVQESIENKTKPLLDMPQHQLDLNKKPAEKNAETVLIVAQQKVNPIKSVMKSAVPTKQPAKPEVKSKKPVPPAKKSAKPEKASVTKPTEKETTVNTETIKKSEPKPNKPAPMRTTTAKPPNKLVPKPVTQNLRGYKKRAKKVKPVVQQQHIERSKKLVELEPQVSPTVVVRAKSVNPQEKLIEEKEIPRNNSIESEPKRGRCSRFGTC